MSRRGTGGRGGEGGGAERPVPIPVPRRLFAIGSQLSPEVGSSGIEMLETDTFKLHCFQTLTGTGVLLLLLLRGAASRLNLPHTAPCASRDQIRSAG